MGARIDKNDRSQKLRWLTIGFLFLLVVLFVTSSLLPTFVARLALARLVPAYAPSLGSATLTPAGRLKLYDLRLYDPGTVARQPLLTVREVEAGFGWGDVLARHIRWIRAEEAIVYARLSGSSPLSLLGLFINSSSDPGVESPPSRPPPWIDTLDVEGQFHLAMDKGFTPATTEWPLTLRMTMSGDRVHPTRRFRVTLGKTGLVNQKIANPPLSAAPALASSAEGGFTLQADFATQPTDETTRVGVHHLVAGPVAARIAADIVRQYASNLPIELTGPLAINLGALDFSGSVGIGPGEARGFDAQLRLQDLSLRLPVGGHSALVLDRFTVAGQVASRLDRWAPATLQARQGTLHWATLSYGNHAVHDLRTDWRIDEQKLRTEHGVARIFGGSLKGSLTWDLATHAMPQCDFQLKGINMHEALAHLAPEHLDAEGRASGVLHLVRSPAAELSGSMTLTFDEPGLLRIGEIPEVRQMLVGNVGLALANLAMRDLRRYPFQEGWISLESNGENSQLQIHFMRKPGAPTEVTPPQKEILDGQEVQVRSLVVPTIDLTVPIRGTSLATILTLVSGVRPLIEASHQQSGK